MKQTDRQTDRQNLLCHLSPLQYPSLGGLRGRYLGSREVVCDDSPAQTQHHHHPSPLYHVRNLKLCCIAHGTSALIWADCDVATWADCEAVCDAEQPSHMFLHHSHSGNSRCSTTNYPASLFTRAATSNSCRTFCCTSIIIIIHDKLFLYPILKHNNSNNFSHTRTISHALTHSRSLVTTTRTTTIHHPHS